MMGLVSLLLVAVTAINTLVIKNIFAVRRIEAANKAYLAAEAGLEDSLYEISQHFAGYETKPLNDPNVRLNQFGTTDLSNRWRIASNQLIPSCANAGDPGEFTDCCPTPTLSGTTNACGQISPGQEVSMAFYNDTESLDVGQDKINPRTSDIVNLFGSASPFSIRFSLPDPTIYVDGELVLRIDNDNHNGANDPNEASSALGGSCPSTVDCDGDGLINEDSEEDPVILWKLTDGRGNELFPLDECVTDGGSRICEKDFESSSNYTVEIDQFDEGLDKNGNRVKLNDFVNSPLNDDDRVQFEFRIVAPLKHTAFGGEVITIPYLNYQIESDDPLPFPYFSLQSDGYYQGIKQSITANLAPKATTSLLDFTIIQQ